MTRQFGLIIQITLFLLPAGLSAQVKADSNSVVSFVKSAVAFYQLHGYEKSLAEFSNKKGRFVKGDLYLTVWDTNGVQIAHGDNHSLIGKNLVELRDRKGKFFVKEFIEIRKKGSGWVDYKWTNPASQRVEHKFTYLEAVSNIIIGCGYYSR